jgi:hypothetical protein
MKNPLKTPGPKETERPLTRGEIDMARLVFRESIDYARVKVYKKKFLPLGIQDDNTVMTPNGNLYCHPGKSFKEDFSKADFNMKVLFIHEMAHVWQWQLGFRIKLHGFWTAITGGYTKGSAYEYDSTRDDGKILPEFNFEQQAEIISHYFAAKYLKNDRYIPEMTFLEGVLKDFLGEGPVILS